MRKLAETSVMGEMLRSASYQPHVLLAESDESTLRVEEHLLQTCGYTGKSRAPCARAPPLMLLLAPWRA